MNALAGALGKDRPGRARNLQPMPDIFLHLIHRHGRQVEFRRDPLSKLHQRRIGNQITQLRLPHKDQLQQFIRIGIDVGKHPQLFQRLLLQVLRLVKDQDRALAFRIGGDQKFLKLMEQLHIARPRLHRLAQRHQHPMQQFTPVALGVGNQPHRIIMGHGFQKFAQKRRLAGSDLARDQRDRRTGQKPVFKHGIGLFMGRGPIDELRVWQKRERTLGQPEKVRVDFQ